MRPERSAALIGGFQPVGAVRPSIPLRPNHAIIQLQVEGPVLHENSMRPLLRRLSDAGLFGALFAVIPQGASIALSCSGPGPSCVRWGELELGLAYFITGLVGWILFASIDRQRWPRVLVLGFIAGAFAPVALWGWIWLSHDPDSHHGMGMITPFIYLLEWIQPIMILIALAASALVRLAQKRRLPARVSDSDESPGTSAGEAIGYGILIAGALLMVRVVVGGELGLQMVDDVAFWSAALIAPVVVWLCVFWRQPRIDLPGMGLAVLASVSMIMLVAVSGPTLSDEERFRSIWMVPGQVAYWGWTNLIETGWLLIPVMALSTLLYGRFAMQRRQKAESIDR